jgi:hypothetical protein
MVDEFAFVPEYLITGVLFPILPVRSTAFLAVTTFGVSPENFATEMSRKRKFSTIEISLLCKPCYDKGVRDVCKHRAHLRPTWINQAQQKLIREALGPEREEEFIREMVGMVVENNSQCFPTPLVNGVINSPRVTIKNDVDFLFVAIDPSGGSIPEAKVTSDFAVCCHIWPFTIVGLDAFVICNALDINVPLERLLRGIMSQPHFYRTSIVLTIEGNLGMSAGYIADFVCGLFPGKVIVVSTFRNQLKIGLEQNNDIKNAMFYLLKHYLIGAKMAFSSVVHTNDKSEAAILDKLGKQMIAYQKIVNGNTVKFNGKAKGQKDDLCIAVQIAVYAAKYFYESGRYTRYLLR